MNEETKQKLIRDFNDAVHVLAGLMAALVCPWYPVLSVTGIAIFGIFEYWQAKKISGKGYHDFWGGVLGYFIGMGIVLILLILRLTGIIVITGG